jgi:hypothetical protein
MIRGNNVWNALRVAAQPSVLTVSGVVVGFDVACLGCEHTVGFLKMSVIGRGRQPDAQNAALADGCRDVALLASPVGVMLVRRQMRGQLGRVMDGGSHQTVSPQPLDESIPEHVVVAEAKRQQPEGNTMRRQQQRVGQLIDGSCHVAEDEAGAEPVRGTIGQDDFPQFQAGQLQRLTPKAVQAIALVEARRKQLRSRPSALLDEAPDAIGIMPDVVVLLLGHRNDDLFGPARHLSGGSFSFTIHLPGLRSRVHSRIPFPGKK